MCTTFKVLKNLQGLTTNKTWQNRTEICYLTLSHPVSKQSAHSSMTTLSGLPRAARVAAWQRSALYTVMSPSIHGFISELCQGRQGAWGRLRDSNSDRERHSGKKKKTRRETRVHRKGGEILKRQTQKWRQKTKRDRRKEKMLRNCRKHRKSVKTGNKKAAHLTLSPRHCQEKRVNCKGGLSYSVCQSLWTDNEREREKVLLIWGVWGIHTNVHYLQPSYFWVKHPLSSLHTAHTQNKVLVSKRTPDHRELKLHTITGLHTSWEENNPESSAKKQNTGWLYVMRSFPLWVLIDSFL